MLIATRFGNTTQLHRVAMPMGAREQLSFEVEPVGGSWSPNGDVLGVQKDIGGNEFFQLYTLAGGQLRLLTDGRSRNKFGAWSHDGQLDRLQLDPAQRHRHRSLRGRPARSLDQPPGRAGFGRRLGLRRFRA